MSEEPLPMPYKHACDVYQAMLAGAKKLKDEHKNNILVWEGFTTHLIDKVGLATPMYTLVLGHLKRMGCIRQLRRGGSSTTSQWELCTAPTEELFQESVSRAKPTTKVGMLEQEIRTLAIRVDKLERILQGAT